MNQEQEEQDNNNVSELQKLMFAQMKRLGDPTVDLEKEIKRSQAISAAGTVIINAAKVQIDAVRVRALAGKTDGRKRLPADKQIGNGQD